MATTPEFNDSAETLLKKILEVLNSGGGGGGEPGPQGPQGPAGTDGKSVLSGTGSPSSGLGTDGDFYIDTSVYDIYGPKTGGVWGSGTSLIGTNGTDGKSVLSGSGVPSSGLGVDGDFYIDTSNNEIYGPKTAGAWGSGTSIVGAPGAPGADGDGTAYYGQVSRITNGTINISTAGTYQSTGLTATLDSEAYGIALGTTNTFAVKNTSGETVLYKIYASADIDAGNNQILGIKLALNGNAIDTTECRASTATGSNFAKLVTNWMIELAPNDEVALFVTNHTSTGNITLNRGRIVASTVGRQGEEGPQGPEGPAGSGADLQEVWMNVGI